MKKLALLLINSISNCFDEFGITQYSLQEGAKGIALSSVENLNDFIYLRAQNNHSINRLGFATNECGGLEMKRSSN